MDRNVLRDWLKAGYMESGKLFPTEAGTPQGGVASPTIANIALDGLDAVLTERFGRPRSALERNRVRLVRYADDFIITGSSKELLEHEVKPCVEYFLAERGLELSKDKTRITHISEGFDFLGQNVRKYDGKLLIKPSAKNVKTFLESVREIIRVNRAVKQGHSDPSAQSQDPGLGELPPTRRLQADVREGGLPHLASTMALGATQASS